MIGIGGRSQREVLESIESRRSWAKPVNDAMLEDRIAKLRRIMRRRDVPAVVLTATSSLYYFTGIKWSASERFFGAVVSEDAIDYVSPQFEAPLSETLIRLPGKLYGWNENENPFALVKKILRDKKQVSLDHDSPFFIAAGLAEEGITLINAAPVIDACRSRKTSEEIALLQLAKNVTLEVQKHAASILRPGISSKDVVSFIDTAHSRYGADNGSVFCIVSFGEATFFPHGSEKEQFLREGEVVLIDTGCSFSGYKSDITRSYVFGKPTSKQRDIWEIEKEAQAAVFEAAKLGVPCQSCDEAARKVLRKYGMGPRYALPGTPHRTGHGIGLDVHEAPYLVEGNKTPLDVGMCFSCEPTICIPGEFGIRLEDHFYMDADGPVWFTEPAYSIDDPFRLAVS